MGALFPHTAHALTLQECKGFAAVAGAYVKAQPKGTFSTVFLDSVKAYVLTSDGKGLSCSGNSITVTSISDLAGWLAIENGTRDNGINAAREITIKLAPGSDPKLPQLIAQRDKNNSRRPGLIR